MIARLGAVRLWGGVVCALPIAGCVAVGCVPVADEALPESIDLGIPDVSRDPACLDVSVGWCAEAWPESPASLSASVDWVRRKIASGVPVLCGVKLYPDEQRNWSLDHFGLVAGDDPYGLIMNAELDMDGQILVSYQDLASTESSYEFVNRWDGHFGRAILGPCGE